MTFVLHPCRQWLKSRWELVLLGLLWLGMAGLVVNLLTPAPPYTLVLEKTALDSVLPVMSVENLDARPTSMVVTPVKMRAPGRPKSKAKQPPPIVNINTAGVDQLDALPGIGPKFAQRIVEYRESHGPFTSAEQLVEVKGIGPKTFEKMKAYVRL